MEEQVINLYQVKTIAQLLKESKISKLRKFLLFLLIPNNFYNKSSQELISLQRGSIIGKIRLEIDDNNLNITFNDNDISIKME